MTEIHQNFRGQFLCGCALSHARFTLLFVPCFYFSYLELPPDRHELDPGEGQGAVQQQLAGGDGGL